MTDGDYVGQRAERGLPALEADSRGSESVRRHTGAVSCVENGLGRALRDEHQVALNVRQLGVQLFRCCDATRELQLRLGVLHLAVRDPVIAETRRLAARVKRGLGAPQLDQRFVDSRRLRSGSALQQVLESRDGGRQADAGSQGIGRVSRCRLTVVALVDRGRAAEPFDHPQQIIGKLPDRQRLERSLGEPSPVWPPPRF